MRDPMDKCLADHCGEETSAVLSQQHNANKHLPTDSSSNSYEFEGYIIHERFNPDGPPMADCIVRVFS